MGSYIPPDARRHKSKEGHNDHHENIFRLYLTILLYRQRYCRQGVPTFIINDRYKIVGAQPYYVFQETLQKIVAENNR